MGNHERAARRQDFEDAIRGPRAVERVAALPGNHDVHDALAQRDIFRPAQEIKRSCARVAVQPDGPGHQVEGTIESDGPRPALGTAPGDGARPRPHVQQPDARFEDPGAGEVLKKGGREPGPVPDIVLGGPAEIDAGDVHQGPFADGCSLTGSAGRVLGRGRTAC
jgi:hypothetical protein